jgi:hypothetical protein
MLCAVSVMNYNNVNLCNANVTKEKISHETLITRGYNHFNSRTKGTVYVTCEANGTEVCN